jgi:hypothetical protein
MYLNVAIVMFGVDGKWMDARWNMTGDFSKAGALLTTGGMVNLIRCIARFIHVTLEIKKGLEEVNDIPFIYLQTEFD